MGNKKITTEGLAVMINNGFETTKNQVFDLGKKFDKRFEQVDKRFDQIDKRFDKIEKSILDDHASRIEKLESKIQYLENILNLPSKK